MQTSGPAVRDAVLDRDDLECVAMSDCSCVETSDGSTCHFYDRKTVRARKPHRCMECGVAIVVGESHERITADWDDHFGTHRCCALCAEIAVALCCGAWCHGTLWEDIEYSLPRITAKCLDKLTTAAAKEKLTAQWREWQGL